MFHVLEGEFEVTLRGESTTATKGMTVNVPANAPHRFHNVGDQPGRLLCMVTPAGLEDFFLEWGDRVESRTSPAPQLTDAERKARIEKAVAAGARYGIENL